MTPSAQRLLREAVLVTGNRSKAEEARRILGIELDYAAIDLPEIQSLELEDVLKAKGNEAWNRLRRPIVVDETGLELDALNSFPGPLIKWLLQSVGSNGLCRLGHGPKNSGATARCGLLYRDQERQVIAHGAVKGLITSAPRGTQGFGWDPIFQPEGHQLTYAEMSSETKDLCGHRGLVWRRLGQALDELV
ncbi:MAG: non-canonical purine NTP pyrophosphatase [Deltaproteobacteria bacterium]|nr:non-canonical purine NTP pyrophosphatase [Deltaproteobacteria bacterium]